MLKEYVARGTFIFPPGAGLRFSVDVIEYCSEHLPQWEPIEFCGYHVRDSGSNAVQEVGVAIVNAIAYLDEAARRGVDIASVVPSTYMFLSAGLDLFEEVAKFRAARRTWAKLMSSRYGVPAENCGLKIFSYTLGSPLTSVEPRNNVVRVAYEALAAVLGGAQTLATSSYDEALGLPSDEAVHLALRTQQILAEETGIRRTADPLGGSYYVEQLTSELERRIDEYVAEIQNMGGALAVLESGWLSNNLADSAYRLATDVYSGDKPVVGLNTAVRADGASQQIRPLALRPEAEAEQLERLEAARRERDDAEVDAALAALAAAALSDQNTVPHVIAAVRAIATVGEISQVLAGVWGKGEASRWRL